MSDKNIFWADGSYEAVGGIYLRNDLFKFFDRLKEKGIKPVGIIVNGWNMEIIVENNDAYKLHLLNSEPDVQVSDTTKMPNEQNAENNLK